MTKTHQLFSKMKINKSLYIKWLLTISSLLTIPSCESNNDELWDFIGYPMLLLGIGSAICAVGGIFYVLRNKAKAYNILMWVFFVPGGFLVVMCGYVILCRCMLAPVFYILTYILKWLCLFIAPILFLFALCVSFYALQNKIKNTPLTVIVLAVLTAGIIIGGYFLFQNIEWEDLVPTWNFQEDILNDKWGTDSW